MKQFPLKQEPNWWQWLTHLTNTEEPTLYHDNILEKIYLPFMLVLATTTTYISTGPGEVLDSGHAHVQL